jgi:hypothetical protein
MATDLSYRADPRWQAALKLVAEIVQAVRRPTKGNEPAVVGLVLPLCVRLPAAVARAISAEQHVPALEEPLLELEAALGVAAHLVPLSPGEVARLIEGLDLLRHGFEQPDVREGTAHVERSAALAAPLAPASGTRTPATPPGAVPAATTPGGKPVQGSDRTRRANGSAESTPPAPPRGPRIASRLLVDGCNFLGRAHGFALGDDSSRDRLLLRLQEYGRRHPAHQITVVFDGQRASRRTIGGVEEQVTSGQRPADEVMIDLVTGFTPAERKECTLVTDDRELARRARDLGTRVAAVSWLQEQFSVSHAPDLGRRREAGVSRSELSEWEEFFRQPPERPGRR